MNYYCTSKRHTYTRARCAARAQLKRLAPIQSSSFQSVRTNFYRTNDKHGTKWKRNHTLNPNCVHASNYSKTKIKTQKEAKHTKRSQAKSFVSSSSWWHTYGERFMAECANFSPGSIKREVEILFIGLLPTAWCASANRSLGLHITLCVDGALSPIHVLIFRLGLFV